VLIGVIGTAIGLLLGYAISYAGGHYHIISLSPEVYSIDYVPFAPRLIDGILVALVAIGSLVRSDPLSLLVRRQNPTRRSPSLRIG
jgi:ABC-type lipoprotein release transport system permease subunit